MSSSSDPTIAPGSPSRPAPASRVRGVRAYSLPRPPVRADSPPIDLHLDANEGSAPWVDLSSITAELTGDVPRRYPSASELESQLAARLGVEPACIVVTAGGDDAIDRACRAYLEPGRDAIIPVPTFEMIERSARAAGGRTVLVPWSPGGPFPAEAVVERISDQTGLIAVVSPNNPTGAVASPTDLARLSGAAPESLLLVDLAYTEFAEIDLTPAALALPNAVVIRTFSKAFGLAGLRVGFAAGPPSIIDHLRAAGGPYPVSAISLAIASAALRHADRELTVRAARIARERAELAALIRRIGGEPSPSQANFVFARFPDSAALWLALADRGIAVRRFAGGSALADALRMTCPGDERAFARLCGALDESARSTQPFNRSNRHA